VYTLSENGLAHGVTLAPVSSQRVPGGVVHELPADLRQALIANLTALAAWKDITPFGAKRVHLLGRGCQARDDPKTPHSPNPGGVRRRPAQALLLAGVQTSRAHRQVNAPASLTVWWGRQPVIARVGTAAVRLPVRAEVVARNGGIGNDSAVHELPGVLDPLKVVDVSTESARGLPFDHRVHHEESLAPSFVACDVEHRLAQ
jgi:hypothetical protein